MEKAAVTICLLTLACGRTKTEAASTETVDARTDGTAGADGGDDATATKTCDADQRSNGETCACGAQCATGFCVDGVCCDTACGGACQSCALPATRGTCAFRAPGLLPRFTRDCVPEREATCGLDGTCDGQGGCRRHVEGTVCQPGICDGAVIAQRSVCDGQGTCVPAADTVCAPFACDPETTTCRNICAADTDCVAGRPCRNGSCAPSGNVNCTDDLDCFSGHCADGFCCTTACVGPCLGCNLPNARGTCSPTPGGQPDPRGLCTSTEACDGFGSCVAAPPDAGASAADADVDALDLAGPADAG